MAKKPLKLNLGSGSDYRSGYVNIDVDDRLKVDKIHDLSQPLPYKTATIDEIILQDVLEHFTKEDGYRLLKECARVLRPDGRIEVRVPNVLKIVRKFRHMDDVMMLYLYGDTSKNGVWGAHKYGYTPHLMNLTFAHTGLTLQESRREETNFVFLGKKRSTHDEVVLITWNSQLSEELVSVLMVELSPRKYRIMINWSEMLLFTLMAKHKQQAVVWYFVSPPPIWLAKLLKFTVLRWVDTIVVENEITELAVKRRLQFSHLRIINLRTKMEEN